MLRGTQGYSHAPLVPSTDVSAPFSTIANATARAATSGYARPVRLYELAGGSGLVRRVVLARYPSTASACHDGLYDDAAERVELEWGTHRVLRGTRARSGTHGVPFGDVGEAAAGVFPRRLIRARRLGPAHGRHLVLKYGVLHGYSMVIKGYSKGTQGVLQGSRVCMGTARGGGVGVVKGC